MNGRTIQTDNVLDMFKEFTENRGVFMPSDEPLVRRRRRTVIYSAKNEVVASAADVVYEARAGALYPIPTGKTKTETLKALKNLSGSLTFQIKITSEQLQLLKNKCTSDGELTEDDVIGVMSGETVLPPLLRGSLRILSVNQ